jgi:phage baseplate assembly protein W
MDAKKRSFLGTGWSFPVSFDKTTSEVQMVSDLEDIAQSLRIILSTIPGERIMQPDFGCNLRSLVFESADATLEPALNHLIYHALLNYEPRVIFHDATVLSRDELGGILEVNIDYSIISTNTRHNIVFPFYLIEGTNISSS